MDQLAEEDIYGHLLLHWLMVTLQQTTSVPVPTLTLTGHTSHHIMWETTTSAIVISSIIKEEMMMMIYGMEKDVTKVAVAVNGTSHLTSAKTSTTLHLRTWKLDFSRFIKTLLLYLVEIFVN